MITYKAEIQLEEFNGILEPLAIWTRHGKIKEAKKNKIKPARRFFRIGTAPVIDTHYHVCITIILTTLINASIKIALVSALDRPQIGSSNWKDHEG